MFIIEITKILFPDGHIIILFIDIAKLELTGGHIEVMLILDITKIELPGDHTGILRVIKITKRE